ncbi:MAG: UDP-N-acetylmuramyl-tripeptide synthetase [Candidatus Kerfeldbacteria bacterium]|nr:UDP-N-acetylmuramyl-tripeptide synthetase [Candidatus Kerfeldbacteria bacterium]
MRQAIRRFVPKRWFGVYHGLVSELASFVYRHPGRDLIVIGVTGTSGKTTVSLLLQAILERAGIPSAAATTAQFVIRDRTWVNDTKMTMLGRFQLQHFLSRARAARCKYAVVETTSEGLAQNRHRGIDYDLAVLTNLTPEHIESHGSFEAYRKAKEKLFHGLTLSARKSNVPKTIIVNADDPNASAFLRHAADRYLTFSLKRKRQENAEPVLASHIELGRTGSSFVLEYGDGAQKVITHLLGRINVENSLAAAAVACAIGLPLTDIAEGLAAVQGLPGRLEFLEDGGVTVIVDYAFHQKAMDELYAVVEQLPHRQIIHVLGATGGGRDKAKRPVLGRIAGERADVVIVTNEDPYDEDPFQIMDDVLQGVLQIGGKKLDDNVFRIYDRRSAITKAVELARSGDIVLVTGKGSEQAIVVAGGKKVAWDDREVIKAVLAQRFGAA